jgi:hypothetical protein
MMEGMDVTYARADPGAGSGASRLRTLASQLESRSASEVEAALERPSIIYFEREASPPSLVGGGPLFEPGFSRGEAFVWLPSERRIVCTRDPRRTASGVDPPAFALFIRPTLTLPDDA